MSFACRHNRNFGGTSGGVQSGSASPNGLAFNDTGTCTFTMNTNGTMTASGYSIDTSTCDPNWYVPTTVGIGNSYWVKFTLNSGDAWDSGLVNNTIYALSSARSLTWSAVLLNSAKSASVTARIYSDAGGTNQVGTVSISAQASSASL